MPSGARTTEHGRPFRWPIIQPPTASKYRARSSLVTGLPSPPSGHSALPGFEITTPITSAELFAAGFGSGFARFGRGLADGRFGDPGHGWLFRLHLVGRLVLAQPLERSLPYIPGVGPAGEFDFGDKLGLQPVQ